MITNGIADMEHALREFRAGRMVIIVDDPEREDEGDLAVAAEFATTEAINFMATHGRGLICLPLMGERLDQLAIPLMVPRASGDGPAFTVSVDARHGISSGTSAHDRAQTVRTILDPRSGPADLVRPGHMFPLRCAQGGVLSRAGHTEASVDLARIAGLYPAAVICEVLDAQGGMARLPGLLDLGRAHGLPVITVGQIIACRRSLEAGERGQNGAGPVPATPADWRFSPWL